MSYGNQLAMTRLATPPGQVTGLSRCMDKQMPRSLSHTKSRTADLFMREFTDETGFAFDHCIHVLQSLYVLMVDINRQIWSLAFQ